MIDHNWIDELVQFSEEIIDENDGYVNEPNTLNLTLNAHNFQIEFHPGDTVYFLDGNEIGCTGSHFKLKAIQFHDFIEILKGITDKKVPLILLPMLTLEKIHLLKIREIIKKVLNY